jgi:gliding motility-associated-like protein
MRILFSVCICILLKSNFLQAQYITNGDASIINCHCYQLTPAANTMKGSVWNANKIDLLNAFDFSFDINFGCLDVNGADGIAFILQPISTSVGGTGSGLGFQGISPSIGVLMDTYQNSTEGDPTYDHISINKNGDVLHSSANNLAGPVQIMSGNDNVEDCNWHIIRIVWNPLTTQLSTFFDGVPRLQTNIDMINTIFGGNSLVYWGFSAATGGLNNLQKFCTRLSSQISTNIINNDTCFGAPVTFTPVIDAFVPLIQYYWNFGDGTFSNQQNPPPHLYSAPGLYTVKFVIKAIDGCDSDTAYQTVNIGAKPVASFTVNDTCQGFPVLLSSTATIGGTGNSITEYIWLVDGIPLANLSSISSSAFAVGNHIVKHVVKSSIGCSSDTAFGNFDVYPKPAASFTANDTCQGNPTTITSGATGAGLQYSWIIDGIFIANAPVITTIYTPGVHTVKHFINTVEGCRSDTASGVFNVYAKPGAGFTVRDTCLGLPVVFNSLVTGNNITYQWIVDGIPLSNLQTFSTSTLSAGPHQVKHIVTANGLCADSAQTGFTVFAKPLISGSATNACFGSATAFTATLNNPPFNNLLFSWFFTDGSIVNGASVNKTFANAGTGTVKLFANSGSICNSDTLSVNYNVIQVFANAGNDTLVVQNQPFSLNGAANGNGIIYNWQPAGFFTNNALPNPVTSLANDQLFTLSVSTAEGCTATDKILVTVFKGSNIFVPNAFTPNGDNVNELLKPLYIGIKTLDYFVIYNRWGMKVFYTTDLNAGWNALYNGKNQPAGNYVYLLKATDYFGKQYIKKGSILIIR